MTRPASEPTITGFSATMGDGVLAVTLSGPTVLLGGSLTPELAVSLGRTLLSIAGDALGDGPPPPRRRRLFGR
jgi:hypothetical protein